MNNRVLVVRRSSLRARHLRVARALIAKDSEEGRRANFHQAVFKTFCNLRRLLVFSLPDIDHMVRDELLLLGLALRYVALPSWIRIDGQFDFEGTSELLGCCDGSLSGGG